MKLERTLNAIGLIGLLVMFSFVVALAWDTGRTLDCLDHGVCVGRAER